MKISTKTVYALYGFFALMGVWFGHVGFDVSPYGGPNSYSIMVVTFFILTLIGAFAQMINIMALSGGEKDPSELYENAGVRIQIGFSFMSMAMFYGYMAGPLHENGAVVSPWLLFPMLAILPIIHMMAKESEVLVGDPGHLL